METVMQTITRILLSTGMTQSEVDHLLARFLEEEAFEYVEYIKASLEKMDLDEGISGKVC
jgi:hypothetical protein